MQTLLQDFRYAFRTLRKTPGVTFAAALALTLGIGLTTAAFSIVYGVLMRGLPYPGADRVAVVFGVMFTIFGAVALILGAVGLYAVMSFSVSRRTREVGIRMALGARGRTVAGMILGKGLVQLAIGVSLGLLLATGISHLLGAVLFDVKPRDPFVFGAVAAALVTTGILACVVPAMRAVRVDPLVALRND
ncbi:MAG TPA: FtsX-like permease family protein [Gemmatimonadaceae bacterium]